MLEWFLMSFVIGCGGFAMAAFSASDIAGSRRLWRQLAWIVAAFAAVINLGICLALLGKPGLLILARDVVAAAFMSVGLTHLVATLASYLYRLDLGSVLRAAYSAIAAVLLSIPAPLVGIVVHCTSGDCL